MTLSNIIKKVSLNKCVEEQELEGMINEFFQLVRNHMGKEDLPKIMINNFGSFVPNPRSIKYRLTMLNKAIDKGVTSGTLLKRKEVLEKNINKQFKHKRNVRSK